MLPSVWTMAGAPVRGALATGNLMNPRELLSSGRLDEALSALLGELHRRPDRADDWVLVAALECVLGDWESASRHFEMAGLVSREWKQASALYQKLIATEADRENVFAGRQKPLLLGEPPEWVGWLAQSLVLDGQGDVKAALQLRSEASSIFPRITGTVNETALSGLRDADPRLGPMLEVCIEGGYYWLPYVHLERFTTSAPTSLIHLVWMPVQLCLLNGVDVAGHLPVRYVHSEKRGDSPTRLARVTDWVGTSGSGEYPVGQHLLQAGGMDFGLLECRNVQFLRL